MTKKKSDFARGRERGIRETLNFLIRYVDEPTVAEDIKQYLLPRNTAKAKLGRPKYGYRRLKSLPGVQKELVK